MTTLPTKNGSTAPATKFALRSTAETLEQLNRPIDPRHFKTRKQGTATLTYVSWQHWHVIYIIGALSGIGKFKMLLRLENLFA